MLYQPLTLGMISCAVVDVCGVSLGPVLFITNEDVLTAIGSSLVDVMDIWELVGPCSMLVHTTLVSIGSSSVPVFWMRVVCEVAVGFILVETDTLEEDGSSVHKSWSR